MKLALVVLVALGLTMAWQASVVAKYQDQADAIASPATADNNPSTRDHRS